MRLITYIAIVLVLLLAGTAPAQNIDMSTLPGRDSVQLTIYNGEDLTLVRETRHLTVRTGANQLQFSWANTLIDASSVSLRFSGSPKGLELIDTRFPHDRPQALYWTVESSFDGDAVVEISYFTSGISWAADYVGTVDRPESSMSFEGFVTIINNSGEDYEHASVRMVVGTINLVEKIAALAQRGIVSNEVLERLRGGAAVQSMPAPARAAVGGALADSFKERADDQKQIVKEGLSEYFIFTVPGTETVKNGWSKRMRLFEGTKVPFRVEYRYRPQEYGDGLVRLYLVRNDEASTLGGSPLPDGTVRLFQTTASNDGLGVLAFVTTKYVPIGQEFEFNLGSDPQVLLERIVQRNYRDEFWFKVGNTDKLVSPAGGEKIDQRYAIAGWNDHEVRVERIRNYRDVPVTVAWRFPIDGDVTMQSALSPALFDYRTPEFTSTVGANTTKDFAYELMYRRGSNQKQQQVRLNP
ncbi:MAG: hypothetical protein SGJ11_12105 [Phycisphaerae bacterium]|nr:hypothetical protein [Phycisphaerae bacterium]